MEESVYKLCWSNTTNTINSESTIIDASFVLFSRNDTNLSSTAALALHKLGVNECNINSVLYQATKNYFNIEEELTWLLKSIYGQSKKVFIINMLPLSAQKLPLEASSSKEAEYLCFESTLEIVKVLSRLDVNDSSVISISCDASEDNWSSASSRISPWGGISRGMAASADLELRQRVISAELRCNADETAFVKVILACTQETAENRIIITDKGFLQPVVRRLDFKVRLISM